MAEKKEENVKKTTPTAENEPEVITEEKEDSKVPEASKLVTYYMWWSMGSGLIPVPLLNLGALAGVQLRMLQRLSNHYGVAFSENRGKSIIATLAGMVTATALKRSSFTSFITAIPVIGVVGALSMSIYSGATTYAIGKVFIQHFETGGTLLDFDPQKVKNYFKELYEEGKKAASKLKTQKS